MKGFYCLVLLLLSCSAFAIQWPLGEMLPQRSFLQERLPMEWYLGSEDNVPVQPIEDGEVIFYYDEESFLGVPLFKGSILILEHVNQYRSIYESDSFTSLLQEREFLDVKDKLCPESSERFGLAVWDSRSGSWVNPLMVLPGIKDISAPVINQVILMKGQQEYLLEKQNSLPPGDYTLILETWDPQSEQPDIQWLPYRLESRYMGGLLKKVEFNGVAYKEGEHYLLDDSSPLNQVFETGSSRIHLGTFTLGNGSSELEISIYDIQGNRSFKSYKLQAAP